MSNIHPDEVVTVTFEYKTILDMENIQQDRSQSTLQYSFRIPIYDSDQVDGDCARAVLAKCESVICEVQFSRPVASSIFRLPDNTSVANSNAPSMRVDLLNLNRLDQPNELVEYVDINFAYARQQARGLGPYSIYTTDGCEFDDKTGYCTLVTHIESIEHIGSATESYSPREFLFVIDKSESLPSEQVASILRAVMNLIANLTENSDALFNIVLWGGYYESIFEQARPVDATNKELAF